MKLDLNSGMIKCILSRLYQRTYLISGEDEELEEMISSIDDGYNEEDYESDGPSFSDEELKPCPFCGGKAVLNEYNGREDTCYYIECPHCHISTQVKYSEAMTIDTWNRRVGE